MINDLRCSMRSMWRERRHAVVIVLILACGIGMATSVFTVYNSLFLRPPPVEDSNEVVVVRRQQPSRSVSRVDGRSYAFVRDSPHPFASLAAVAEEGGVMSAGARTERVRVLSVTGDYFDVLGRPPMQGRAISTNGATDAVDDVVIVGESVAQRFFGSVRQAVGGTVSLNGRSRFVVGVMAEDFVAFAGGDVWIPLDPRAASYEHRSEFLVLGRLGAGVDLEAAEARLDVVSDALLQQAPEMRDRFARFQVTRYRDYLLRDVRSIMILLSVAVGSVLLLTCVNGSGLVLARGLARRTEFVTRLALGASPGRIVRQILVDNLLLAAAAGILGVGMAFGGVRAFVMLDVGQTGSIAIDERVLLFSVAISCVSGLGCGIVPARVCAKGNLHTVLREQDWGFSAARQAPWLRRGMVVGQMGASFVLVVLAVLFIAGTLYAMRAAPGFDSRDVGAAGMILSGSGFDARQPVAAFLEEGVRRVLAVPGVEAAAVGSSTPGRRSVNIPHELSWGMNGDEVVTVDWRYVTPEYFGTMRIPLRRGRYFSRLDRMNAPAVAIVNRAFMVRHGSGGEVMGQRVRIPTAALPEYTGGWREIVGVVGDVVGPGKRPDGPAVYVPVSQVAAELLRLVHRSTAAGWFVRFDPGASIDARVGAAAQLRALDRQAPLSEFRSMDDIMGSSLRNRSVQTVLLGTLAVFALAVTAGGVYGLMCFLVAVQAREFGIRLALGSSEARLLVGVLAEGVALAGVGALTGGFLWLLARAALAPVMPAAAGVEPVALAAATGVLAVVAVASGTFPSLQLLRVGPARLLRKGAWRGGPSEPFLAVLAEDGAGMSARRVAPAVELIPCLDREGEHHDAHADSAARRPAFSQPLPHRGRSGSRFRPGPASAARPVGRDGRSGGDGGRTPRAEPGAGAAGRRRGRRR